MTDEWMTLFEADDDQIEALVLSWSGLWNLWNENELFMDNHFIVDIVELCSNVEVITEAWDEGMPGGSSVIFKINSNNPDALKKELTERVVALLEKV